MSTPALFGALWLLLTLAFPIQSQNPRSKAEDEQSIFGGEEVPDVPFIKHQVAIPQVVLQILEQDATVKSCLTDNAPTPDIPFSSWFVASEVHLDGQNERDLVVLPNPRWQPSYGCFHSASGIQWFWIFQKSGEQYRLLLTIPGNGIEILHEKHAGHRDIRNDTIGSAGRYITTVRYRFDGTRYQMYKEKTEENRWPTRFRGTAISSPAIQ